MKIGIDLFCVAENVGTTETLINTELCNTHYKVF